MLKRKNRSRFWLCSVSWPIAYGNAGGVCGQAALFPKQRAGGHHAVRPLPRGAAPGRQPSQGPPQQLLQVYRLYFVLLISLKLSKCRFTLFLLWREGRGKVFEFNPKRGSYDIKFFLSINPVWCWYTTRIFTTPVSNSPCYSTPKFDSPQVRRLSIMSLV